MIIGNAKRVLWRVVHVLEVQISTVGNRDER